MFRGMIAPLIDLLGRRKKTIRVRMPQNFLLVTSSNKESIDATFDEAGRLVTLIVHTRVKSLRS